MFHSSLRQRYRFTQYHKLALVSVVVGFLAALLAVTLKRMTEYYQELLLVRAEHNNFFFLVFPAFGLSLIYILRKYLFKGKENKGIKEVFESTSKNKALASFKIPSHFINGLLTVSFGGSTGIEVSTVVSTAAIGSLAQEKERIFSQHKTELVCAGISAGLTALFCTPLAGLLFSYEVIAKKVNPIFLLTNLISAATAFAFITVLGEKPLFAVSITEWNIHAVPYFLLLGVLCGLHSIYFTKCVLFFKAQFAKLRKHHYRIAAGAAAISLILLVFPQLYGDGYHVVIHNLHHPELFSIKNILLFAALCILKPVVTSLTLSAGGDGGVFGPSLFIGALAGLLVSAILTTYFNADILPLNFMVVGMAAMLSATIHAPFTALFLVCGLIGDYTLFFPLLLASLAAKYAANAIYPYTVYTPPAKTA